jgi:hypothetical protein
MLAYIPCMDPMGYDMKPWLLLFEKGFKHHMAIPHFMAILVGEKMINPWI